MTFNLYLTGNNRHVLILKLIFCWVQATCRQWLAQEALANDTVPYNSPPNCKSRQVTPKRQHNSLFQDDASTKKTGPTNTTQPE
jgi:hypothetical protein